MRTAIIGTGITAAMHAQALKELGHEIVYVINPNKEKAAAFAQQWGIPNSSNKLPEALQAPLDTIHICTPPSSHYEIIKAALEVNLHVFSEKPLCSYVNEAVELYELSKQHKRICAVNFNNRFYDSCQQARETISSRNFGSPHLIHGSYLQEFHVLPDYYSWRYQPQAAGPMRAVTEIGSHWIDLARYWSGLEVSAVSATFGKFSSKRVLTDGMMYPVSENEPSNLQVDSEDAATIVLRFSNGALGRLLLSEVSHGRQNQLKLEVSSQEHSIWWNSEHPYQLHQAEKEVGIQTTTAAFSQGFSGTFKNSIQAFYQTLQQDHHMVASQSATLFDGAVNVAVCEAIYESACNESKWIDVQPIKR